ncbi:MAG: MOSC domain-containing protein [Pseudomonadota bacterium]
MNGEPQIGKLIGIARRAARRLPIEEISLGEVTLDGGLIGDHKGAKFPKRQITVLSREAWEDALNDIEGVPDLPWTARRANFLVEGVALPRARGGIVQIGPVRLEVTYPTVPCGRMDEAHMGLRKALYPEWRGGITCRVLAEGEVRLGDAVDVLASPPEHKIRLPG